MYKVNDVVVYRRNVCKVTGTVRNDMTGELCYVLVPYENQGGSVRMQVPVSNKGGHLRDLITKQGIKDLCRKAPSIETLASKPANMKSSYANAMNGDSLEDLVCIIKTSYQRNMERRLNHKKLASVDEEYLEKAEKYLYTELSVVLDMPYDKTKEYFEKEVARQQKKAA